MSDSRRKKNSEKRNRKQNTFPRVMYLLDMIMGLHRFNIRIRSQIRREKKENTRWCNRETAKNNKTPNNHQKLQQPTATSAQSTTPTNSQEAQQPHNNLNEHSTTINKLNYHQLV